MSDAAHILSERSGPIARITLNRPEKRNAIALRTVRELREALEHLERDPDVRVVVLSGSGDRAFASGADLDEFRDAIGTPEQAAQYDAQVTALYGTLQGSRLPIIARIQAHAIGAGCLLALACDLRVASDSATFGLPAGRIGLMLSPHEFALACAQLGPARAKLLLYTGRRVDARQALEWGLIDAAAPIGQLDERVDALAQEIAVAAPLAVQASKRMVNALAERRAPESVVAACYRDVYGSADLREGLAAFKARRAPVFRGR